MQETRNTVLCDVFAVTCRISRGNSRHQSSRSARPSRTRPARRLATSGRHCQIAYKSFIGCREPDGMTSETFWNTSRTRSNGSAWTRRTSRHASTQKMAIPQTMLPTSGNCASGVTVHTPGSSDGAGWWVRWASTAQVRKAMALRSCWRQVSTTVSIVSTKRLPSAQLRPKGKLSPNHRMTQRPFARVVRRLNSVMMQARPQPAAMSYNSRHVRAVSVAAFEYRAAAILDFASDGTHPGSQAARKVDLPDSQPSA